MNTLENTEIYHLIANYISGNISSTELERLRIWMEESEENRKSFVEISAIVQASEVLAPEKHAERQARMLQRLNARLDAEDRRYRPAVRRRNLYRYMLYTLSAAAIAAFFFLMPERANITHEAGPATYANSSDDVIAVKLEDSTRVWLAKGGAIEYRHPDSESGERIVTLSGNAYFDVHKDSLHPFIVNTENIAVKVLGTAFAVESSDSLTSVFLERGSVGLQTLGGVKLVRLHPDQLAVFNAETQDLDVTSVKVASHIINNYSKVVLDNASLQEIILHINSMYGTDIAMDNIPQSTRRYNLSYQRTDSLEEVLDIVKALTGTEIIRP